MVYLQRWHGWCHMKLLPSRSVLCTPYNTICVLMSVGIVQRFELESRCFINGMYYYYYGDAAAADDGDDKDLTWCTT